MDISELQRIYAGHPNTKGLAALLEDSSVRTIFLGGLHASAAALFVSSFLRENKQTFVFVLGDLEEAGYFYHDLTQVNGDEHILFFPSSYRRAVKYGQKDAANEILRTDVLAAASSNANTNVSMMGETFKYCAPVAGALGFSVEDTAEAIGLMGNAGIKASQAGTSMRSIMTNLTGDVKLSGYAKKDKISVQYFDVETAELKLAEMYVTGYKAKLKKDTSYKGLWTVSFTLKEM